MAGKNKKNTSEPRKRRGGRGPRVKSSIPKKKTGRGPKR